MWRVPDFLPVCLQDKLRYRKPAVREQERLISGSCIDRGMNSPGFLMY